MATSLNLHFRLESVGPPDESNWRVSRLRFLRICDWPHACPTQPRVWIPQRLTAVLARRSVHPGLVVIQSHGVRFVKSGNPLVLSQSRSPLVFERISVDSGVDQGEHAVGLVRLHHRDVPSAPPTPDHFHNLPPTRDLPTALKGSP